MAAVPELGGMKLCSNKGNRLLFFLVFLLLVSIVVLQLHSLNLSNSISGSLENGFLSLTPSVVVDSNSLGDHSALAFNQQVILIELQKINLFSECVFDSNSVRSAELPIDDRGGFRRVSIVTLVCPEIVG